MSAYIKWTLIMAKGKAPRRRYAEEFKRKIVAEANAADVSVSEIARRHGLNANLLFNWRKKFGADQRTTGQEVCLVPVELSCGSKLRCGSDINPALLSQALSALKPNNLSSTV
mgnify:CR=1 FL=1